MLSFLFICILFGFGIWGHLIGFVPEVSCFFLFVISSFIGIFISSLLEPVFSMYITLGGAENFIVTGIIILSLYYLVKLFFIPKDLSKMLYIDVPVYYLSGAFVGFFRGYFVASLLLFGLYISDLKSSSITYDCFVCDSAISIKVFDFFNFRKTLSLKTNNLNEEELFDREFNDFVKQQYGDVQMPTDALYILKNISKSNILTQEELIVIGGILLKINVDKVTLIKERLDSLVAKNTFTKISFMTILCEEFYIAINDLFLIPTLEERKLMKKFYFSYNHSNKSIVSNNSSKQTVTPSVNNNESEKSDNKDNEEEEESSSKKQSKNKSGNAKSKRKQKKADDSQVEIVS